METTRLQTLDRGLIALRAVAESRDGLKISELAKRLGVHRAIAYRIAGTLEAHQMVYRLPDGRLILGSGIFALGATADTPLRTLARPVIEKLADASGATAFLCLAQGEEGVAILVAEPRDTFLNIHYRLGTRHPLNRGAAGIAILAGRPATEDEPEAVTRARKNGYSVTRGELQAGAVGVASPLRLTGPGLPGLECSIGVVALEGLETEKTARLVREAAETLQQQLTSDAPEIRSP
ncbi:IclR family transcriptional regulator [Roseibium sp.]|uniref:IclR family transcriptional regulator n=1 Tax=Roseibium sp. TaxID=1936156 RepID=UPI003A9744C7